MSRGEYFVTGIGFDAFHRRAGRNRAGDEKRVTKLIRTVTGQKK
jgi:hypothetical protein